jgi:hypothetical protein
MEKQKTKSPKEIKIKLGRTIENVLKNDENFKNDKDFCRISDLSNEIKKAILSQFIVIKSQSKIKY